MTIANYVHVDEMSLTKVINILINAINSGVASTGITGITAGTTRTQAGATLLSGTINRVDTSTAPAAGSLLGDGVKLPASASGKFVVVENNTANPVQVYGSGTDTINGVATATGVTMPANSVDVYWCAGVGAWQVEAGVGYSGSLNTVLALDNITAATGGQGSATQLVADINRVTTVAATAGVKLPASSPGLDVIVINKGANPLQVFGSGTDQIDDQVSTTGVSQMVNSVVLYVCTTAGKWYANGLGTGFNGSFETQSYTDGLTAHAGGGQGSAVAVTTMISRFTTVATTADSAILPTGIAGMSVTIINAGANAMAIFPDVGSTINGGAANASVTLNAGKTATFVTTLAGAWHMLLSA